MEHFWTNTVWYIVLGILTLFELTFVMAKVENRKFIFAFYLTLMGIVLNYETIIFIFFNAYAYYPMILKKPPMPIYDMLLGNLFSQTSVAASALLVVVLNLRYYWFIFFAVAYGLIEELFLYLGIYSHNWYQTWMTVVSLPIYFYTAKIMYRKINSGMKPLLYIGYIYLGVFLTSSPTLSNILIIARLLDFNTTLFPDPVISHFLIFWVHFHVMVIPILLMIYLRFNIFWKALVLILIYIVYFIGYKTNFIWIREGWFIPVSSANIWGMYLSVFVLDRLYGGIEKRSGL